MFVRVFLIILASSLLVLRGADRKDGMLFYNSFERGDFGAMVAQGTGEAQKQGTLRTVQGIRGKAVVVGQAGGAVSSLSFATAGNLSMQEGTVSFWFKALDWDQKTAGAVLLWGAAWPNNEGFRIYKFHTPGYLWFLSGCQDDSRKRTATCELYKYMSNWKKDSWHQLTVSYRRGGKTFFGKEQRVRLYVDGKLIMEKILEDKFFPRSLPQRFHVGPESIWDKGLNAHTAIDEIRIYGRELSGTEIMGDYLSLSSAVTSRVTVPMRRSGKEPFKAAFPEDSAHTPFYDRSGKYAQKFDGCRVSVSYDEKQVYVHILEKVGTRPLKCDATGHDSEVYRDDSYEVFLGRAAEPNAYRHYIVNSRGAVFDEIGKSDKAWQGTMACLSQVKNGIWDLRLTIPYSDLGSCVPSEPLLFNVSRNYFDASGHYEPYSLCNLKTYFHQPKNFCQLVRLDEESLAEILFFNPSRCNALQYRFLGAHGGTAKIRIRENGQLKHEETISPDSRPLVSFPLPHRNLRSVYAVSVSLSDGSGKVIAQQEMLYDLSPDILCVPTLLPDQNAMNYHFETASHVSADALKGIRIVRFTFLAQGRKIAVLTKDFTENLVVPLSELPQQDGELQLDFLDGETKVLFSNRSGYLHSDYMRWKDFAGGLDKDEVPAPWKPIRLTKDTTLEVLGRDYVFGKASLPVALREHGHDLLRQEGVQLLLQRNGKEEQLGDVPLAAENVNRGKVVLKGRGECGGVEVRSEVSMDFDGYCVWTFTLDHLADVERLALRIPLTRELSQLQYIPFTNEKLPVKSDVGKLTQGGKWAFGPGVWVGNDLRGVTLFTESDESCFLDAPDDFYVIDREADGSANLTMNLITSAGRYDKPLTYRFGIQVTPVKPFPEPEDFLAYGFVNAPNNRLYISGFYNKVGHNIQGFPGFRGCGNGVDAERRAHAYVMGLRSGRNMYKKPLLAVQYMNPNMCPITVPEYGLLRKYCQVMPNDVWGTDGPEGVPSVRMSPNSSLWANLYCYRFEQYFADSDVNGIYSDFAHPIKDINALSGSGYERNGKRYPTYCLYKYHELQKRLYILAKRHETPERRIFFVGHSGGTYCLPHANFWDMVVDPEYLGGVISLKEPTLDYLDADRIRAEYNGRQFGTMINFIPIRNAHDAAYTNDLMTMLTAAGICWWNHSYFNQDRQNDVFKAYQNVGFTGNDVFLPFWCNDAYVTTSNPEVKCTMLGKKDKLVLSVCNFSKKSVDVTVTVQLARLFGRNATVEIREAVSGQQLKRTENGSINVTLSGRNFAQFILTSLP